MNYIITLGIFGAFCLTAGYWVGAWHAHKHYRLCTQLMKAVEEKEHLIKCIERDVYEAIENKDLTTTDNGREDK